jgi:hypothetical protein
LPPGFLRFRFFLLAISCVSSSARSRFIFSICRSSYCHDVQRVVLSSAKMSSSSLDSSVTASGYATVDIGSACVSGGLLLWLLLPITTSSPPTSTLPPPPAFPCAITLPAPLASLVCAIKKLGFPLAPRPSPG